jgi:hypothetical protein
MLIADKTLPVWFEKLISFSDFFTVGYFQNSKSMVQIVKYLIFGHFDQKKNLRPHAS